MAGELTSFWLARGRGVVTPGAVQPYVPTGTLLAGFEATNEWSQLTSKAVSLDPADAVQGTNALKYTATATSNTLTIDRAITSLDPMSLETYAVYIKLDTDIDWQSVNSVTASFRINNGGTVYPGASKTVTANVWTDGFWLSGNVSQLNAAFQGAGVGNHGLRIATAETNAQVAEVVVDAYYKAVNAGMKTPVVLTFDDAKPTQYSIAYPDLQSRGLKGTFYIPTGDVDAGGAGVMTWAQIQEMGAAGHNIQINGTSDDDVINQSPQRTTVAAWVADLNAQADTIVSKGLPRPTEFCWPFGYMRFASTRIQRTGINLTSGTDTLALASTTGITVGMRAILIGVSKSCRVIAVNTDVSVQLSEPMTLTATSKAITFVDDSNEFHGNKPTDAAIAAGFKWGRSTINARMFVGFGNYSRRHAMMVPSYGGNSQTGAALLAIVDAAILEKAMVSFYIHGIAPGELTQAEWTIFIDGLKTRSDAGTIEVTTFRAIESKYGPATVPA